MNKREIIAVVLIYAQVASFGPGYIYADGSVSGAGVERAEESVKKIRAADGGEVSLGKARVVIPPGALERDTEIRIRKIWEVAETGEGLINATAGGGGYRFEPAGTVFRVEVKVEVPYDRKLDGKGGKVDFTPLGRHC
jgi:hypothetical protein